MQFENLIGGRWQGQNFTQNVNPSDTADVIGEYASATLDETQDAIRAAAAARGQWRDFPPAERVAALRRIGNTILERRAELGAALSREEGKIRAEGIGEATRAGMTFLYYASQVEQEQGSLFSSSRANTAIHTARKPVGAVGIITPWNFPLAIPAWKIAPALAFGNTVVFKPADLVPSSAWLLAEIIHQSGIPDGVFNLVMGKGRTVGDAMAKSPDLNAITFTGSTATGLAIARAGIANGPKRIQTEMGGKNSLIVLDDADLVTAIDAVMDGAFVSTGQRCTATSRVIATRGIYPSLIEGVAKRMKGLRVGHALEADIDIGPLASQAQFDQVSEYIELGQREGAELVAGGEAIENSTPGYYLQPALFAGGASQMRINQEEIFGPVACVIETDDLDDAIITANDTRYGLCAGIITDSNKAIVKFQREMDAGMLHVNRSTALTELHVPFGGSKSSSYGPREQGTAAREFFTTLATVYTTTVV
ncbi:aldehyde dehydrogenase family protein [Cryobacterium sp. PH29-G1]|uniref:aldehyde dehydrogenase family protein n=1 Tax=Cryobacterium sp. PH29-G1 TaxID=3046211 RepID=UPI0024B93DE6|nr:aldehyde dehydrogenase family protein [Cryobacterium sp. PH29-G1]MDJ0348856.1 aldehyde dehydrogenase family protein [Cryobacterium sp. PH29-G1]